MHLFTDGSVHTTFRKGVGGYLMIENLESPLEQAEDTICLKSFENTSSTELELRTLLWALDEIENLTEGFKIYTDSQNIAGLLDRRKRLEQKEFQNSSGNALKHAEIYQEFFQLADELNFEVIKVKGHSRKNEKTKLEIIFSLLDRATRKELRRLRDYSID
jgi:ribonuclease HI